MVKNEERERRKKKRKSHFYLQKKENFRLLQDLYRERQGHVILRFLAYKYDGWMFW